MGRIEVLFFIFTIFPMNHGQISSRPVKSGEKVGNSLSESERRRAKALYEVAKEYERGLNKLRDALLIPPINKKSGDRQNKSAEMKEVTGGVGGGVDLNGTGARATAESESVIDPMNASDRIKSREYYMINHASVSRFAYNKTFAIPPVLHRTGAYSKRGIAEEPVLEEEVRSLHPETRPFWNFTLESGQSSYTFQLEAGVRRRYYLSVVVEKMQCHSKTDGQELPMLSIEGEQIQIWLCADVDNSLDDFQSVDGDYTLDGSKQVTIRGYGNWTGITAHLAVSIYYESSQCHDCSSENHFCCGKKQSPCSYLTSSEKKKPTTKALNYYFKLHEKPSAVYQGLRDRYLYRCIPKQDSAGNSLLCNGHPNCGFYCNWDEHSENCPKDDGEDGNEGGGGDDCPGYTCREDDQPDRFFITAILLVIFCLFIPFCIFVFFCSRKDLRREFLSGERRCPWPLEILLCPFSINADVEGPGPGPDEDRNRRARMREEGRRNERRLRTRPPRDSAAGVVNPSYFDDPPPPYSEACRNKAMYPDPPKYCSVEAEGRHYHHHQLLGQRGRERSQSLPSADAIEFIVLPLESNHQQMRSTSSQMPTHWCQCNQHRQSHPDPEDRQSSQEQSNSRRREDFNDVP